MFNTEFCLLAMTGAFGLAFSSALSAIRIANCEFFSLLLWQMKRKVRNLELGSPGSASMFSFAQQDFSTLLLLLLLRLLLSGFECAFAAACEFP